MGKLSEEKVFRDPICGYVRVDDSLIWDVIQSKEVQRLRRVKQLGSTSQVYHTGEHSRFSHSLGVYEIVRRMVEEVVDLRDKLSEEDKLTVKLAGLLHDVGHAPFSHSFESILNCHHEQYTINIITQDSQVNRLLKAYDESLPSKVASVIDGTHNNKILCQLISSQLDADRMDYLLRDSYCTGTKYGEFDLERILRTIRIADDRIVVKASGIHTIEDYIMARYHMYWQVYYHPVSRSFEALLNALFTRLRDLYQLDKTIVEKLPMYKALLEKDVLSNEDLYKLDDSTCYYSFNLMSEMDDEILKDLSTRILSRNLFKYDDISSLEKVKSKLTEKGFDLKYYLYCDHPVQRPYQPYSDKLTSSIWVKMSDGRIEELSKVSHIVSAICLSNDEEDSKVFFPKEIL